MTETTSSANFGNSGKQQELDNDKENDQNGDRPADVRGISDISTRDVYKAMLRKVLREQIQMLVEQLSEKVGEETMVLSASVSDGSISSLGSAYGRSFIQADTSVQARFQTYCLNTHSNSQTRPPKRRLPTTITRKSLVTANSEMKDDATANLHSSEPARKVLLLHTSEFDKTPSLQQSVDTENQLKLSNSSSAIRGLFPNIGAANSDYLMKLNSTVGVPNMSQSSSSGVETVSRNDPETVNEGDQVSDVNETSRSKGEDDIQPAVKVESEDGNHNPQTTEPFSMPSMDMFPTVPGAQYIGSRKRTPTESDKMLSDFIQMQCGLQNIPPWSTTSQSAMETNALNGGKTSSLSNPLFPRLSSGGPGNSSSGLLEYSPQRFDNTVPRTFQCQFCDKEFREKTNLKVHLRTHTGERPFKCSICGKDFAHSSNLKQHERGVHKLPPKMPQYKQHFYNELTKMMPSNMDPNQDGSSNSNMTFPSANPYSTSAYNQFFPSLLNDSSNDASHGADPAMFRTKVDADLGTGLVDAWGNSGDASPDTDLQDAVRVKVELPDPEEGE